MNQLRKYLTEHDITQVAFASMIGVSEAAVSGYLSGNLRPSKFIALKISSITGIPLLDLLFTKQEMRAHQ